MINLRYHIVSITAVFLALGIGVALGGTFLDRAAFDVVEGNVNRAEARIRDTEAANAELNARLNRAAQRDESLVQAGGTELFDGLLSDVPVLVIAQPDVGDDLLRTVNRSLVVAGADLRGTIEVSPDLAMTDRVDADVANAVSVDPERPDEVRGAVNSALRQALIEAGAPAETGEGDGEGEGGGEAEEPGAGTTTTTAAEGTATTAADGTAATAPDAGATTVADATTSATTGPGTTPDGAVTDPTRSGEAGERDREEPASGPDGTQPAIVTALVDADLLRFTPGPGYDEDDPILEATGYRYLFVGAPTPDAVDNRTMLALLPATPQNAIPAVLAVQTPDPLPDDAVPTVTAAVIDHERLGGLYSTVDNVGTFSGLTAAILSLRDVEVAETGHYGQAAGATSVLPVPGGS